MASGRSAVIGFAKQTAEGTAATTPAYEIPMAGGLAGPARTTEDLPWTTDSQDVLGNFVSLVAGNIDFSAPVLPVSAGSLLQGVLGARTTTGTGPYTHVFTPADSLPWMTFFYAQPGTNYHTLPDSKVGSWELSWNPGNPLEVSCSGNSKDVDRSATKWGAATLVEGVDPFFTYIGATMKFDVGATPAATTVRNIAGGSISVNRNLDAIQTDAVSHQYLYEQTREIGVSLDDVVFENNDTINTVFYGSASGTNLSGSVVYGSADFTFIGSDSVAAATRSLRVELLRVLWTIDQVPEAVPGGDTVRYTVTGRASKSGTNPSIRVTLINGDSGANY